MSYGVRTDATIMLILYSVHSQQKNSKYQIFDQFFLAGLFKNSLPDPDLFTFLRQQNRAEVLFYVCFIIRLPRGRIFLYIFFRVHTLQYLTILCRKLLERNFCPGFYYTGDTQSRYIKSYHFLIFHHIRHFL